MYKVCLLDQRGKPAAYCVFSGEDAHEKPTSPFYPSLFSPHELAAIAAENCPVILSSYHVYPDESVKSIKQKLIWALTSSSRKKAQWSAELGEICAELEMDGTAAMYLFGQTAVPFSFLEFYQNATNQDTVPLTRPMMSAFLENFRVDEASSSSIDGIYQTSEYVGSPEFQYEQWSDVDWFAPGSIKTRLVPIGLRFVHHNLAEKKAIYNNADLFSVNPAAIANEDAGKVYVASPSEVLTSANYEFLLSYGDLVGKTLYAYSASTVTAMWANQNVTEISRLTNTYFPLLKRVFDRLPVPQPQPPLPLSLSRQQQQQQKPTDATVVTNDTTQSRLPTQMDENVESIMSFLSGVDPAKHTVKVKQSAIQQLTVTILPEKTGLKFPLDTVFKNVHATINIPFIQFNAGLKREKSYRLYHESVAQNGNAIPFVSEHVALEFK